MALDTRQVAKMKDEEIYLEIAALKRRLFELRSQEVTEKIVDTSQFRKIRSDIARLKTGLSIRNNGS